MPAPEEMSADTELVMAAGDSAYFTGGISGQATNAGQEPTAILVASIADPLAAPPPAPRRHRSGAGR